MTSITRSTIGRLAADRACSSNPSRCFAPWNRFETARQTQSTKVVLLSPQGRLLTQSVAQELSQVDRLVLICGRYEGVDERVAANLVSDEISIGDFVLSGGELPAAVLMESTIRLLPGVLGNEESIEQDSFSKPEGAVEEVRHGLLDCPHYTRPAEFRDWKVPDVLLSGDHTKIRQWRRQRALEKTWRRRPDLLAQVELSKEDRQWLDSLKSLEQERRI